MGLAKIFRAIKRGFTSGDGDSVEGGPSERGKNLHQPEGHKETPLHYAAGRGDVHSVRSLLRNGADASIRDELLGSTPLAAAVTYRHPAVVAILLSYDPGSNNPTYLSELLARAIRYYKITSGVVDQHEGSTNDLRIIIDMLRERGADPVKRFTEDYGETLPWPEWWKTWDEVAQEQKADDIPPKASVVEEVVMLKKCGGCGSEDLATIEEVLDRKQNRGYLCSACKTEYAHLLQADSIRRFWMCGRCGFRILAGTRVDAAVDPHSLCPNCQADVNSSLVNLSGDRPVKSDAFGSPVE